MQLKIKNGNTWEGIPASGVGVPSGGTAGQVLTKISAADYATEWADLPESESGANYIKFPDGTMIQWIEETVSSGWSKWMIFPNHFIDTTYIAFNSIVCNTSAAIGVTAVSKQTNQLVVSFSAQPTSTAPATVTTIAIGRWK